MAHPETPYSDGLWVHPKVRAPHTIVSRIDPTASPGNWVAKKLASIR